MLLKISRVGRIWRLAHMRHTSVAAASTDAPDAISDCSAMFAHREFMFSAEARMPKTPAWSLALTSSRMRDSAEAEEEALSASHAVMRSRPGGKEAEAGAWTGAILRFGAAL